MAAGAQTAGRPSPVVLVVIDGFGVGPRPADDAIVAAGMPRWRALVDRWPNTLLDASGPAVGLPEGQMGNSEVGHLNLGAGRPVLQDYPRVDAAIADGSFFTNEVLLGAAQRAATSGRRLHAITLLGPGGVHAHDRHAVAFAELARRAGVRELVVHLLLDGRDTPPRSAEGFLDDFSARLAAAHPGARIGSVGGRYFGMDRDQRWDRVARHWAALVDAEGLSAPSPQAALAAARERDESDEFVTPTVIAPETPIEDGDVVVHLNFRADRARQLTRALCDPDFSGFPRPRVPAGIAVVTLTEYEAGLPVAVAFPPLIVTSLAEIAAGNGWTQLHVAETEKYAHVTYFFNGGVEDPWPGEDRLLIPSPRVATYDLQPGMSAEAVTDAIVAAVAAGRHDLIVANLANPDMVGHTGSWDAAVAACRIVDACIGRIADAVLGGPEPASEALLAITADHGNADVMRDAQGGIVTAHSLSPVPFLLAGRSVEGRSLRPGVLADVTPTLLEIVGLPAAPGMTGHSLLLPARG